MIAAILQILSAFITLFTLLCFIDIILTWFPGAKFTAFGRFISTICDPYLNFFSRFDWLRFGNIDFSPIISIGILSALSSVLGGITATGRIYLGGILGTIIAMLWQIVSSIATLLLLLMAVRYIVLLVNRGKTAYSSAWQQLDYMLGKITYKISSTFVRNADYRKSLLVSIITVLVIIIAGRILTGILISLCHQLPF